MTPEEKIWDIVHNWCDAQSCEISDFAKRALMDQINGLLELTVQPSTEIVPIGTKVKVTKRLYGHEFKIGEEVFISDYYEDDSIYPYKCVNPNDYWLLSREEFEPV